MVSDKLVARFSDEIAWKFSCRSYREMGDIECIGA
jgi:hypothetical protein